MPLSGDLLDPGIQLRSPALQVDSLPTEPPESPGESFQFSSVAQLCPTLCDPMECSMPGFPVLRSSPGGSSPGGSSPGGSREFEGETASAIRKQLLN